MTRTKVDVDKIHTKNVQFQGLIYFNMLSATLLRLTRDFASDGLLACTKNSNHSDAVPSIESETRSIEFKTCERELQIYSDCTWRVWCSHIDYFA